MPEWRAPEEDQRGGMPRPPAAKPKPTARPAFDPAELVPELNAMGWDWEPGSDRFGVDFRWVKLRADAEKPSAAFQAIYEQNKAAIGEWVNTREPAAVATPSQGGSHASQ